MIKLIRCHAFVLAAMILSFSSSGSSQEKLIYHDIRTDASGNIIPWCSDDLGASYDHVINLVWNFWDTMRVDINGLPYYMNHQVWKPGYNDPRGLGGDQLQMALSSWLLLYAYSGNERVKQNMKFIADYYLTHSLSPSTCPWPNLPFPYNTFIYSGTYDGDMVIGKGYLQPDKAGSLGLELVHMFELTSRDFYLQSSSANYLNAAKAIARTLMDHLQPGDENKSPLPFKVNAFTGETGELKSNAIDGSVVGDASYTSNWCPTMELFLALESLDAPNRAAYDHAFQMLLSWMKRYPLKNDRWGMFFEDVQGWSDTQINATTCARFIMKHREYFPDWGGDVRRIFDWVYKTLGNKSWEKYGVTVVNEQTVYQTPGESHTSRQAEAELLYCVLTGDTTRKANAVRQLSWATYTVDFDGKNRFPQDEPWLTDGYGDYVRHYIRSMEDCPELAPTQDHILSSTSIVQQADYKGQANKFLVPNVNVDDITKLRIFYRTYDSTGVEQIRMVQEPTTILLGGEPLEKKAGLSGQGYAWKPLAKGGVLTVRREHGIEVTILE